MLESTIDEDTSVNFWALAVESSGVKVIHLWVNPIH
jgi:hypothetical protein